MLPTAFPIPTRSPEMYGSISRKEGAESCQPQGGESVATPLRLI